MQIRIWNSLSELDYQERGYLSARNNVYGESSTALQQEYQTLRNELEASKSLASEAGVDATSCINYPEEAIFKLQQQIADNFLMCQYYSNLESTQIRVDATYNTDVLINHVEIFEFQLEFCSGDFICVEPLLSKIELAIVDYPQKIDLELENSQKLYDELKVSIKNCLSEELSRITGEGSSIVNNAVSCVNNLLPP